MRTFPLASRPFPVVLPRSAFGPRLTARAGDVLRALQDVVTEQSSSVGWTPERFVEAGVVFVVRDLVVRHHREVRFGEVLSGRTWPARSRRDTLFTREVRLFRGDELVTTATQEWALVSRALEATKATPELSAAFTIEPGFPSTELPAVVEHRGGSVHHFGFTSWHLHMDTHGHVNHPAYVDCCDEGLSRALARAGFDAQALCPVAEEVRFKTAIGAAEEVKVETVLEGVAGDVGVFGHRVLSGARVCAIATTYRRLLGGPEGWALALS